MNHLGNLYRHRFIRWAFACLNIFWYPYFVGISSSGSEIKDCLLSSQTCRVFKYMVIRSTGMLVRHSVTLATNTNNSETNRFEMLTYLPVLK